VDKLGRGVAVREIRLQRSEIGTTDFMASFLIVSELFS
jgi:hypothetical protein